MIQAAELASSLSLIFLPDESIFIFPLQFAMLNLTLI